MAGAAAAQGGWTPVRSAAGDRNPWLIAMLLSVPTFMEVLDTSIANVALSHVAGGLSVSYDEATWVVTSYLVANAIVIPLSGWLAEIIGRKRFFLISIALFTGASFLCGLAPDLTTLVIARILQGIGGGCLAPNEQSMLVDSFPPEKRGQAFALFGFVVIMGPTIGPTLGGVITDNINWHWVFLINIPVGLLAMVLVQLFVSEPKALEDERRARLKSRLKIDGWGVLFIALGLGFLEVTLDRGQRLDWWGSPFICVSAALAAVGLVAAVVRELTTPEPILDLKLLGSRNFSIAMLVMLIMGVILFATTQFIPQYLQEVIGYTATDAGLAMTMGGAGTLLALPLAGYLSGKIQPRWMMGGALIVEIFALWNLTHLDTQVDFVHAAQARLLQAVGIPFLFVPLSSAAYVGLPADKTSQGTSIQNVFRNLGGTFGISTVQTLLARREQVHQSQLAETMNPLNPIYAQQVQAGTARLAGAVGQAQAPMAAVSNIYRGLLQQSAMLAYLDAFWVLMLFVIVCTPFVFLLKSSKLGSGAAAGGH